MIRYRDDREPMGKGRLERHERLRRVCKHIIDGGPDSVDDDAVARFKSATLKYAHTFYDAPEQALKNIFQGENEVGGLVRKAFAVIDDAGGEAEIAKKGESGVHGLVQRLLQHSHDMLRHRRRFHGLEKRGGQPEKESTSMTPIEHVQKAMKDLGPVAVCKDIVGMGRSPIGEAELVAALTKHASEQHPELKPDAAFSKLFETEAVWQACQIAKAGEIDADPFAKAWPMPMSLTPAVSTGADAFRNVALKPAGSSPGRFDDAGDLESNAYEQLTKLAEQQRRAGETASAAFTRIYLDPANRHLAEAERAQNRPV
jgi:hypothetical protein